eukprot:COSAG06_NODE_44490_length_363_cov_0.602273_1_plen_98_part_01
MAAGGVSRPCQGALDDSQGARVDVWSGWKRAGGAAHRVWPLHESFGWLRAEFWAVDDGLPATFRRRGLKFAGARKGLTSGPRRPQNLAHLFTGIPGFG